LSQPDKSIEIDVLLKPERRPVSKAIDILPYVHDASIGEPGLEVRRCVKCTFQKYDTRLPYLTVRDKPFLILSARRTQELYTVFLHIAGSCPQNLNAVPHLD
jgi:hypothetical protein